MPHGHFRKAQAGKNALTLSSIATLPVHFFELGDTSFKQDFSPL